MVEKKYGNPISVSTCFSSSYDSDDMDGWESDCSGPIIEAHSLKASYKSPESRMENTQQTSENLPISIEDLTQVLEKTCSHNSPCLMKMM